MYRYREEFLKTLSRLISSCENIFPCRQENIHAYTLFARTEDEKNKWIEAIREALNNVMPSQRLNSTHEAAMHTFDR